MSVAKAKALALANTAVGNMEDWIRDNEGAQLILQKNKEDVGSQLVAEQRHRAGGAPVFALGSGGEG